MHFESKVEPSGWRTFPQDTQGKLEMGNVTGTEPGRGTEFLF